MKCKFFLQNMMPVILVMMTAVQAAAQRDTIALDTGWTFVIDKNGTGEKARWFESPLAGAKTVPMPHTWNIDDSTEMHYGWSWYQKTIKVPAGWKHKRVVLLFGAVNHTAMVYVNGALLTTHTGDGFNKFYVPLDGKINFGADNLLTVAVNNDYGTRKVPYGNSFDWPNDGGIIRPVALLVSDKPAASYIHLEPALNQPDSAGHLAVKIGFDTPPKTTLQLDITIREENQPTSAIVWQQRVAPEWVNGEAVVKLRLPKVNPWHFDFPNLYNVNVAIVSGNKTTDRIAANTGFRNIAFVNGRTLLNGEPVKLMGVEWTAGSNPQFGLAEPASEIIRHGRLMKEVNAIFSRVHFQQDDLFFDFCDRNGILVQEEVPLWGWDTPPGNDTVETIAMQQLKTMISNHYNHPSIITWGVGNELRGRDSAMKGMIARLITKAKALDPYRFVSYVSNSLNESYYTSPNFTADAASMGDYIMMNEYGGSWWNVPTGKIHQYLDSVHMSYPDKPFFIAEFGLCEPNFKGGDDRRIEDLIYHMAIYESKPYVQGAIYFDLTDYRTHYPGTMDNNRFRRRIHGVYDMYGQPKPSMKVLRELSSPVEVQNVYQWKKGKITALVYGSVGLPEHTVRGYQLYLTDSSGNFAGTKAYPVPTLKPGEKAYVEMDDLFGGKGIITLVRPNGFVTSQKSFY